MPSTVIHEASMDIYYGDSREMETIPCQVKLQQPSGDLVIEYFDRDYNQHTVYRGKEIYRGHYQLETSLTHNGRATLHYIPTPEGTSLLEGFWLEKGHRGMWQIFIKDKK